MKSTGILVKTSALILGFTLVLGVGILSLSFSHGGARRNEDTFLTPEHAVAPPTAQELLQKKFDAYNTVTEEDGKSVVTIFSEEQIKDFNNRRDNGEWFSLSAEEALFLISDTKRLFENYDIIRIRNIDGTIKTYLEKDGASQNSTEAIYDRITVFNPNLTYSIENTKYVAVDMYSNTDTILLETLFENIYAAFTYAPTVTTALNDCYYSLQQHPVDCGVFVLYNDSLWYDNGIYFFPNIKNIDIDNMPSCKIDF
ncbi:MAG: hypothetical protein IKK06_05040 [Clostridia bacterium]|nr:hypothetical protein [Clostridia bacterium]